MAQVVDSVDGVDAIDTVDAIGLGIVPKILVGEKKSCLQLVVSQKEGRVQTFKPGA